MLRSMLTTIDNPFSPFDNFSAWYAYDVASGYHTSSFLARIVKQSDELSDADLQLAIDEAIEEIVRDNISGVHIKVQKEFPDLG